MSELRELTNDVDDARVATSVRAALSEVLERDLSEVPGRAALFGELGLDSTGVLDLLMYLEEDLGIEFDTDSLVMSDFATVDSFARFVTAEMAT